ncbi:MAG: tetratricopeptide repeat protein [Nannocystaceae bacterium]
MDRLGMLQQFLKSRPDDPFVRYGLAMEYKKLGRLDEATAAFAELLAKSPEYVAAYLMAGNTLEEAGQAQEALAMYTRGAEVARAAGDEHATSELVAAHEALAQGSV